MFPESWENGGWKTTTPGFGNWDLRAGRDSEVQMFARWRAGKERAQRPVRHKGESKRRNGDAGQEKGGEKGKHSRGGDSYQQERMQKKGWAGQRTERA